MHERGVGETRSCGTGAVAAAYAALVAAGRHDGTVVVDVPGGRLSVRVTEGTTVLTGPAVLVAAGELSREWLRRVAVSGLPRRGAAPSGASSSGSRPRAEA